MFKSTFPTWEGIPLGVKFSHRPRLRVSADGAGLVGPAGSRLLAERSGLDAGLAKALAGLVKRRRRHDPGRVLVDLAVTLDFDSTLVEVEVESENKEQAALN